MAAVVEVNSLDQLQSYRLLWKSLFPRTPKASFFHTFEWLETYWKHFGDERRMRVLVVFGANGPLGIVPFCVQRERYHVGSVNVLTYPMSDWGLWYGPIGPNPAATMLMAVRHLQQTPRDWDLIDLRWTPPSSAVSRSIVASFRSVGWAACVDDYQQTSNIELSGYDWESFFESRSKKWRHETRRQRRVLEREGGVVYQRHRPAGAAHGDDDPNWEFYDKCLEVSRRSWQATSQDGNTLCHGHVQPFLRDCHAVAAKLGMLDMTLLTIGEVPTAFQYNYHYDGRVFGLRMGYDHRYSKLCTGSVLFNHSLEDSFSRGDQLLELGIGDSRLKQRVRTQVETSQRICYYPWSNWRSRGVRLTRLLKSRKAESSKAVSV